MMQLFRYISKVSRLKVRWHSSLSFKYLNLENTGKGYSILKMNRNPVNSLNLEFTDELIKAIDIVEETPESRGLVITSSLKVFSAGLDISEFYNPKKDESKLKRLQTFAELITDLMSRIYQSPLITIAAINGASPAAGCALILTCDYRIMVDSNVKVGLNESHLGVPVPLPIAKLYQNVVGHRLAEKYLSLGTLMTPQEALKIGLIDDVVSPGELMPTVATEMEKWLSIPEVGRRRTKELLRRKSISDNYKNRKEHSEWFYNVINEPAIQEVIGMYYNALQQK